MALYRLLESDQAFDPLPWLVGREESRDDAVTYQPRNREPGVDRLELGPEFRLGRPFGRGADASAALFGGAQMFAHQMAHEGRRLAPIPVGRLDLGEVEAHQAV